MLIIDRMRQSSLRYVPSDALRDAWGDEFIEQLMDTCLGWADVVPVFKIDNVATYAYEHFEVRGMDSFPTLVPPFPEFWMEYTVPAGEIAGSQTAMLFSARDADEPGVRWWVDMVSFSYFPEKPGVILGPSLFLTFGVAADGRLCRDLLNYRPADLAHDHPKAKALTAWRDHMGWLFVPFLLGLSFLNCKNVVVTEEAGRYANRQDRRAAERRDDPPLVKYRTLHIEPMKTVLKTEGGIEQNGLKKALHICRGHFAEYGDDYGKGKLFGKYEGRFFIPAHVRGSAEQGVIDKRYVVHPPKGEGEAA